MQIIPRSQLVIRARQRAESTITPASLSELRESIRTKGLLQPPFGWQDEATGTWILTGGRRRVATLDLLAASDITIHCNGYHICPGFIPILSLDEALDEVGQFEAELDENLLREPLSWQDRCAALAELHKLRTRQHPEQSVVATAREVAEKSAAPVKYVEAKIAEALLVEKHLLDPTIAKARNMSEAHALVLKKEEESYRAILAKRSLISRSTKPEIEVHHANLLTTLPTLAAATFDLILSDPPYGVDANAQGFRGRTVHHHNYDDSSDNARHLLQSILTEGFRVTKPRANLFLFTDIEHFFWLRERAGAMGWVPFRTPIIWQKSESEGLAPWGGSGPRRTYDLIFYATKGQRGLVSSPTDILTVKRVPRAERTYAAEKPVELMRKLIECSTLPGESVFDPCCGSGSTLIAARECQRRGLGFEIDEAAYNTALSNIYGECTDVRNDTPAS